MKYQSKEVQIIFTEDELCDLTYMVQAYCEKNVPVPKSWLKMGEDLQKIYLALENHTCENSQDDL